jgi:hypothetical protein
MPDEGFPIDRPCRSTKRLCASTSLGLPPVRCQMKAWESSAARLDLAGDPGIWRPVSQQRSPPGARQTTSPRPRSDPQDILSPGTSCIGPPARLVAVSPSYAFIFHNGYPPRRRRLSSCGAPTYRTRFSAGPYLGDAEPSKERGKAHRATTAEDGFRTAYTASFSAGSFRLPRCERFPRSPTMAVLIPDHDKHAQCATDLTHLHSVADARIRATLPAWIGRVRCPGTPPRAT